MTTHSQTPEWTTLVSAEALASTIDHADLVAIDARFALSDPSQGERDYAAAHIPGARYAHLGRDLSDQRRTGHGRHPLPDAQDFCARLGAWGISPAHQVVVYDARDGSLAAARVWFMLRLLGHKRVVLLDGGFARWSQLGLPVTTELQQIAGVEYRAKYDESLLATAAELLHPENTDELLLVDVRGAERFRGEVEPLDRVAGHVPGAINWPFPLNLQADGRWRPATELAADYCVLLDGRTPDDAVLMCGSGVTACHSLLAMEHAGLPGARLYADSWSGWISDPSRPIATGAADH